MKMTHILPLLALVAMCGAGHATVCTVTGYVRIQPEDTYYCDTSFTGGGSQSCTGWKEVDLDAAVYQPMRFLKVTLRDPANGNAVVGSAFTDSTGHYSVTGTMSGYAACADRAANVGMRFARVHESDAGAGTPRFRFRLRPHDELTGTYEYYWPVFLTGPTTTYNREWARPGGGPTTSMTKKLADIYYTVNSMISEVTTWTSNLSDQFASTSTGDNGIVQIRFDDVGAGGCTSTGCASQSLWSIRLAPAIQGDGGLLRHELGHLVHFALHHRNFLDSEPSGNCHSSALAGDGGRESTGCEWGSYAMLEGFPSFLALRSITTADTNAWFCSITEKNAFDNGSGLDTCSTCRPAALSDTDRMVTCAGQPDAFRGIGDDFVTAATHCIRLTVADGCAWSAPQGCNDSNNDGYCDGYTPPWAGAPCKDTGPPPAQPDGFCDGTWYQTNGWRNYIQILRFYWDMLDTSSDGGQDDTDLDMGGANGFAALIEAMDCSHAGCGVDGNCNEFSDSPCVPDSTTGPPANPPTSSRDAYNPFDFASFIPLDQNAERAINCVAGAGD